MRPVAHPQTLGKVERLHQTPKRYLAAQAPAQTPSELQGQLDAFARYYNHIRQPDGFQRFAVVEERASAGDLQTAKVEDDAHSTSQALSTATTCALSSEPR